ncbi:ParA family protein [Hyphomonas oceanitis]|uniref:ParA family protein n=1 Tax=Hyphomonas oceanitis TaxID=81033 RepID=UPI00300105EA
MFDIFGVQISWAQILAGFIGMQILGLAWSRTRQLIANMWDALFRFVPAVYRFHDMRRHFRGGGSIWSYRATRRLTRKQRDSLPKVLTVMNFKGGVGKTTLVANLACSFALKFGLKILVVDLDYQGSLTSLLKPAGLDEGRMNLAGDWLKTKHPHGVSAEYFTTKTIYPDLPIDLVTAGYELTEVENNQLQRWLLHADDLSADLPTKFARTLSWAKNGFTQYDLIIMDAPPRLSVASINALVASSHVLIPAKLEHLATEPIRKLLDQLKQLAVQFGAKFSVLGVVCNMTWKLDGPIQAEIPYFNSILSALPQGSKLYQPFVPDKNYIGKPGTTAVAYMLGGKEGETVRSWFDQLAHEILQDMELLDTDLRIVAAE